MEWQCPIFLRGSSEYEAERRKVVWNGRKPNRYPEIIVQANNVDDVIAAVKYAASANMKIGIRSGGHSWSASFLRQDGMLIEVSRLNNVSIDATAGTAAVGPGLHGGELNDKLKDHGYMFPGGHCPTVGLGGYLLQGGFGWNSRKYGLACESLIAIDVVIADGTLIHATPESHEGLYWAARGSGHGFFGVVTQFYLKCHPLPRAIINSRFWLSTDDLDEVITHFDKAYKAFPAHLEVSLFIGYDQDGLPGKTICVRGDSLALSRADALDALNILHRIPVLRKAIKSDIFKAVDLNVLLQDVGDLLEVNDHEYMVDNTWMDEPLQTILPQLHTMVDNLYPAPSHVYILYWNKGCHQLPDMAFSINGNVYIAYFAIYKDSTEYNACSNLVTKTIASIADKGCGSQLGDENLLLRPSTRFMKPKVFARLEALREIYDPYRRFHGYMALNDDLKRLAEAGRSVL